MNIEFYLATWFGMSITSCSFGFSPSIFIAFYVLFILKTLFRDTLYVVENRLVSLNVFKPPWASPGASYQSELPTQKRGTQWSHPQAPSRSGAQGGWVGCRGFSCSLLKSDIIFRSTLSYLCRLAHRSFVGHQTDQWSLAWRSSSWFFFSEYVWNKRKRRSSDRL